jgi:predicted transcriptional regulator
MDTNNTPSTDNVADNNSSITIATATIVSAALQGGMPFGETEKLLDLVMAKLSGSAPVEAVAEVEAPAEPAEKIEPAVTARKSLASPDHIISMLDGKKYKTLRRHLTTNGLTPEQYRERFNLKADYPMVAASYSEARRAMAKKIGLGRKPGQTNAPKADGVKAPRKNARKQAETANA